MEDVYPSIIYIYMYVYMAQENQYGWHGACEATFSKLG